MAEDEKIICKKCGGTYEKNSEGVFVCNKCGKKETASEREKRFVKEAKQHLDEESVNYKEKSVFEKFAKEYNENAFKRPEKIKFAAGEFEETATSAQSGEILKKIKQREEEAQAADDRKKLLELIAEEEAMKHEHDRRLAREARERIKSFKFEADMPFELVIDSDGLVKMKFGRYPQTLLTDAHMIELLDEKINEGQFVRNEQGWFRFGEARYGAIPANPYDIDSRFENGEYVVGGKFYYFRVEPILWRVLAVRDDEALLLSDKILSVKDFNADKKNGKWNESYIRDWLNTRFVGRAFDPAERKWIKSDRLDNTTTANKQTLKYAGDDTEDGVFLAAHSDIVKRAYGFSIVSDKKDPERRAYPTDYAVALGAPCEKNGEFSGYTRWWLRSPGATEKSATSIEPTGRVNLLCAVTEKFGVRVALRIRPYLKAEK